MYAYLTLSTLPCKLPSPPPPSQAVPPELRALITRCWSGEPMLRPDFKEVITQLEAIQVEVKYGGQRNATGGGDGGCCCS